MSPVADGVSTVARAILAFVVVVVSIRLASTQTHLFLGLMCLLLGALGSGVLLRPLMRPKQPRN